MSIQGSCLCGKTKIETSKDFITGIVRCFCRDCQKHLGNFAPWVVCEAGSTTISGPVKAYPSSETAERLFCTDCGASLAKRPLAGPKILIAAGIFEQPLDLPIVKEVFTEDKQDWM